MPKDKLADLLPKMPVLVCPDSPIQRHHWIINQDNTGECKYCHKVNRFPTRLKAFEVFEDKRQKAIIAILKVNRIEYERSIREHLELSC